MELLLTKRRRLERTRGQEVWTAYLRRRVWALRYYLHRQYSHVIRRTRSILLFPQNPNENVISNGIL